MQLLKINLDGQPVLSDLLTISSLSRFELLVSNQHSISCPKCREKLAKNQPCGKHTSLGRVCRRRCVPVLEVRSVQTSSFAESRWSLDLRATSDFESSSEDHSSGQTSTSSFVSTIGRIRTHSPKTYHSTTKNNLAPSLTAS